MTLPMRPRDSTANLPYLVTPLSVLVEEIGKKILCVTGNKSNTPNAETDGYLKMINSKIGFFNSVYTDFSIDFLDFVKNKIPSMPLSIEEKEINVCECGFYEELLTARKFNLNLLDGLLCKKCSTPITRQIKKVLLFQSDWSKCIFGNVSPKWVKNDLNHFMSRQVEKYLFCKDKEKIIVTYHNENYGVRYQFQWALLMLYVATTEQDKEITLHYVNRVQDKAFFVSSIVKMLDQDLKISFKSLPVIWPSDVVKISDSTDKHINLLKKGLSSKRKEIKV